MAVAVAVPHRHTVSELIGMPWDDYLAALEASEVAWCDEEYVQGMKALRLSTDCLTYQALLRGQPVPVERLDPVWARRYGLL